jgi:hypothetical protein
MTTKIRTTLLTAFFFFGLLIGLQAQTQIPKDSVTGAYSYQGIIKVDSASKQQLYAKTKAWVLKTLKSSDNMVDLEDKEFNSMTGSGTIIMNKAGGGGIVSYVYEDAKLNFKATFQFKDGKVKYKFDNFTYSANKMIKNLANASFVGAVLSSLENLDLGKKEKEQILNDASSKMSSLVNSFSTEVSATSNKLKDDW